jgi:hypothetical protein
MSDWWTALCLFVFTTHLPFFVWRWRASGEPRFAATSLTFALLAATYALLMFAPEVALGAVPAWKALRVVAWISAAASIGLLARHQLARLRGHGAPGAPGAPGGQRSFAQPPIGRGSAERSGGPR